MPKELTYRTRGVATLGHLAVFRRKQLCALALLGFVLAGAVVCAASLIATSSQALRDGVASDHAQLPYSVQAGSQRAAELLDAQSGLHPVRDEQVALLRSGMRTNALLRVARTPIPIGVLVQGRRPSSTDEVVASSATLTDLNSGLGDRLDILGASRPARSVTVVGVVVHPADRGDRVVVGLAHHLEPRRASIWLSETDPYAKAALMDELDRRTMTYQRVATLAEARAQDLPGAALSIKFLPLGIGLIITTALLAALAGFFPGAAADAATLQAAGLSPSASWRPFLLAAACSVLAGELLGTGAGLLALNTARERVAELFNQSWLSVSVPAPVVVSILVATALFFVLVGPVARWVRSRVRHARIEPRAMGRQTWAVAVTVVLVGTTVLLAGTLARYRDLPGELPLWAPAGAAAISGALPVVLAPLAGLGMGASSRALLRDLVRLMLPVAVGVALLATLAGSYTSRAFHDTRVAEAMGGRIQPPGSLLVYEVPDDAARAIVQEYRELGGSQVDQYLIPDESRAQGRVTSPAVLACAKARSAERLADVPVDCYPRTSSPLNIVVLSSDDDSPAEADPALLQEGRVGVLLLETGSDTILDMASEYAQPNAALGGDLPGLVVPAGAEAVRRLGLVPGGTQFAVLGDFGRLPPAEQSQVRGMVSRLASAAQVRDSSDGDVHSRRRAVALGVALAGAALAFLLMLIGGSAALLGSSRVTRGLLSLHAGRRYRLYLFGRLLLVPGTAILAAAPLVVAANAVVRSGPEASYGAAWLLPVVGGLVAVIALLALWMRVPRGPRE